MLPPISPPPYHPSVVLPVAPTADLFVVNGPREDAVAVSVANIILLTTEDQPLAPVLVPPHHPYVVPSVVAVVP